MTSNPLQLKDLTKGQKFKVVGAADCPVITFSHLDGMYSYNTIESGEVVHLRYDTPVEVINEQPYRRSDQSFAKRASKTKHL